MKTFQTKEQQKAAYDALNAIYEGQLKDDLSKAYEIATQRGDEKPYESEEYNAAWKARSEVFRQMTAIDKTPIICPVTGFDLSTKRTEVSSLSNQLQPVTPEVLKHNKLYLNVSLWSDCEAYEVIAATPSGKTLTVRPVKAIRLDDPNFVVGGFAGHCTNNHSIRYRYESLPEAQTMKVRVGKKNLSCGYGRPWLSHKPNYHHDYNF